MARYDDAPSRTRRPDGATAEVDPAPPTEAGRAQPDAADPSPPGGTAEASPARSGAIRWIGGTLAVVLACLAGWWWLGHGRAGPEAGKTAEAPRVPVEVAKARTQDVPIFLDGLGTVQALNTVLVRSRVDGEIQAILFQEGQTVRQGDVLVQIDPRTYRAALDQAVARKQQNEATRVSNRTDLARTQDLSTKGFAPRQQLDQQTAAVGAIDAQILIDQAQIDNARVQLDYTTIRAPLTGRTGLRLIDQGNIVHASDQTGIVEIAQVEPIAAVFTAPEAQLPEISAALKAGTVEVRAVRSDGKEELARGTLSLVNNEVDTASGTVRLKAIFPNAGERLWPGLSVNTRLLVRTLPGVVTVPADAVQRGPSDLFVFVVTQDGSAEHRAVKVGPILTDLAVIEDGLKAGETIVTRGQSRLKAGTKVDPGRAGGAGTEAPDRTSETNGRAATGGQAATDARPAGG